MSNTETKIKEMDMTDSIRCFFNEQTNTQKDIVQGHTCTQAQSLTLMVDNGVIVH